MENVPLNEVLQHGKAPNPDANSTVAAAKQMQTYMKEMIVAIIGGTVGDILINTTMSGPSAAHLIPLQMVQPQPPDDAELFMHVELSSTAAGTRQYSVSQWEKAVASNGLELATRNFMLTLDPAFTYLNVPKAYGTLTGFLDELYVQ